MTTTPDYRAAANELLKALSKVQDWDGTRVGDAMDALESALLAAPEAVGVADALQPDFIDANMQGQDREILATYYSASLSEGGTADEVILRGLRAVLSRYGTAHAALVPVGERLPGARP
jgi:hypothetical protein